MAALFTTSREFEGNDGRRLISTPTPRKLAGARPKWANWSIFLLRIHPSFFRRRQPSSEMGSSPSRGLRDSCDSNLISWERAESSVETNVRRIEERRRCRADDKTACAASSLPSGSDVERTPSQVWRSLAYERKWCRVIRNSEI